MLIRLSDDRILHVETGTLITVTRGGHPSVSWNRLDFLCRTMDTQEAIDALDAALAAQDAATLNQRVSIPPGVLEDARR